MSDLRPVICPYCGQPFEVEVDVSAGRQQQFVSDCEVCCRPIQFAVTVDEQGEVQVASRSESGD